MKKFIVGLFVLGLASPLFSQVVKTEELSEVVVMAVNYKYLNQVDNTEAAIPVKMLERKAAAYDVTTQDYYQDDFEFYTVSFFIPDGKLVAVYDAEGKIIRTIEKFNNVSLPDAVKKAVLKRYPNWTIVKDVYRVSFADTKGETKTFNLKLKNGDKVLRVKMNEDGELL